MKQSASTWLDSAASGNQKCFKLKWTVRLCYFLISLSAEAGVVSTIFSTTCMQSVRVAL